MPGRDLGVCRSGGRGISDPQDADQLTVGRPSRGPRSRSCPRPASVRRWRSASWRATVSRISAAIHADVSGSALRTELGRPARSENRPVSISQRRPRQARPADRAHARRRARRTGGDRRDPRRLGRARRREGVGRARWWPSRWARGGVDAAPHGTLAAEPASNTYPTLVRIGASETSYERMPVSASAVPSSRRRRPSGSRPRHRTVDPPSPKGHLSGCVGCTLVRSRRRSRAERTLCPGRTLCRVGREVRIDLGRLVVAMAHPALEGCRLRRAATPRVPRGRGSGRRDPPAATRDDPPGQRGCGRPNLAGSRMRRRHARRSAGS